MKIKDGAVIEFDLLKDIMSALNSEGLDAWTEVLIQDFKHLKPIIEDAYNAGYSEGYTNAKNDILSSI